MRNLEADVIRPEPLISPKKIDHNDSSPTVGSTINKEVKQLLKDTDFNDLYNWVKDKSGSQFGNFQEIEVVIAELGEKIKTITGVKNITEISQLSMATADLSIITMVYNRAVEKMKKTKMEMVKIEKEYAHSLYALGGELEQWLNGKNPNIFKNEAEQVDAIDELKEMIEMRSETALENINQKFLATLQPDLARAIEYSLNLYKKSALKLREEKKTEVPIKKLSLSDNQGEKDFFENKPKTETAKEKSWTVAEFSKLDTVSKITLAEKLLQAEIKNPGSLTADEVIILTDNKVGMLALQQKLEFSSAEELIRARQHMLDVQAKNKPTGFWGKVTSFVKPNPEVTVATQMYLETKKQHDIILRQYDDYIGELQAINLIGGGSIHTTRAGADAIRDITNVRLSGKNNLSDTGQADFIGK